MNNIEDIYPLSPIQQGLLFHTLYAPQSGVYISQASYLIQGKLNIPALKQACQQMVSMNSVMRTAFVWERRDEPIQIVYRHVNLPWDEQDWRGLKPEAQDGLLKSFLQSDRERGFNLSQPPLLRFSLIFLSDDSYRLVWTQHHILMDGWSSARVSKQVFESYEALSRGVAKLFPPGRPYSDYFEWLKRQDVKGTESFWRGMLKGFNWPTPLVIEKSRGESAEAETSYNQEGVLLTSATVSALQAIARRHRLTLNTLLGGAWALLLSRYSGLGDVVFGTVVSGRPADLSGVETMIGLFVNTLPVRAQIEPAVSTLAWLKEYHLRQIKQRQYEFTPLTDIQGWSDVPRNTPLFESVFVYENFPKDPSPQLQLRQLSDMSISEMAFVEQPNYPLTIVAVPGSELMRLNAVYLCQRFDGKAIMRTLAHLKLLIESIAANPEQRIEELSLLTESERQQILVEWTDTRSEYVEESILQIFETQVEAAPQAIALTFEDEELTYKELNRRANQLAHYLRRLGAGPETLVGIYMPRSIEMVVGLLGALKAGGAYVPLDPTYPAERLNFILEDAAPAIVITKSRLFENLSASSGKVKAVDLITDWGAIAQECGENPPLQTTLDHRAYVIYTSGSTGEPKGIEVTHRGVTRLVRETNYIELGESVVMAQASTVTFDAATFEIWGALLNGGRLSYVSHDILLSPAALSNELREQGVSTIFLTTALFNQVAREAPEVFNGRREVLFGGEQVDPRWVAEVLKRGGPKRLLHVYGPTETTTFATWGRVDRAEVKERETIPIGRPISNTQVYVLDGSLRPSPVGVTGDLYIAGAGLARGYLKRAALTSERFVADSFGKPGTRMYRTGDLARWREDGQLEFLGRIDRQVKLRGFRIELGEVEAALLSHDRVCDAVVVVDEQEGDDKRLVAYVVACDQAPLVREELQQHVRQRLPEYMTPAVFMLIDKIPLTPNGKLDHRSLPAPVMQTGETAKEVAPSNAKTMRPRTVVEEVLAGIWAEVLGIESVSVYNNFFELGGHSLMATRAVSRIREVLQVTLTLRDFFEEATMATLARRIEKAMREGRPLSAPPIVPTPRNGELMLSFAQQRLWFFDQLEPGIAAYNIPFVVRLRGRLNIPIFEQSISEIVRRHETLRTVFQTVEEKARQIILPTQPLGFEICDLSALTPEEREHAARSLAESAVARAFDLSTWPLLRIKLLRLGDEEHILSLTMHHIISDGWSIGVFMREIGALFRAYEEGRQSTLSELSTQYVDYAVWQREWLRDEALSEELNYWKGKLRNVTALELPTDRPRPAILGYRGAIQLFTIPDGLSRQLKNLSRREGSTLFMTLLAAFKALLYRYAGQEDLCVGTPISGRHHPEIEDLIGFFVNTLALRTDLSGNPSFRELIRREKMVALEAYTHQELPFEKLVDALSQSRDLSRTALFQVMFVMQNFVWDKLEVSEVTISGFEAWNRSAQFELTLTMQETAHGLGGEIEYSTDLFDDQTIQRMLGHFQALLAVMAAEPKRAVSEFGLLNEEERRQLLVVWNDTRVSYARDKCIHQLFEAQVEAAADAVAVVYEDMALTYGKLNSRANQVARYLRQLGAGPDVPVGLCVERSIEAVVGLLGVLKAGGAYVPLDPTYPRERLSFILRDSGARLILTHRRISERLAVNDSQEILLDGDWPAIAAYSAQNLVNSTTPDNSACVLYTSGSTGKPKGVTVRHRSLVNYVESAIAKYELTAADRFLQFASISFDSSAEEFFCTLSCGAKLVLREDDMTDAASHFLKRCGELGVTVLVLPTAYWHELTAGILRTDWALANGLRLVIIGGESALLPRVKAWAGQIGQTIRLLNTYGPTEATIVATKYDLFEAGDALESLPQFPIGRPIRNVQIYVLDQLLQPVPIGVYGELYIGGVCLSRGYLNRPELTAGRFIPNPFDDEAGERLYRTGDIVRYLPDGNLEFLGRADQQVKLRGFRIELGEIEAAIISNEGVAETVVAAVDGPDGSKRLIAYVVATPSSGFSAQDIRRDLRGKLPEYMIPAAFVLLDRIPLTSTGKYDRRALPQVNQEQALAPEDYVPPQSIIEEIMAGVWADVLSVDDVGIDDNFFEMGGHSLLATQVISRARTAFKVEVALRKLFERPTVRGFAEVVQEAIQAQEGVASPPIKRAPRDKPLPLSFAQQRLWFLDQLEPNNPFYNMPEAVRLKGRLDVRALEEGLNEVVRRHEALRTKFESVEGKPLQVILPAEQAELTVEDLSSTPEVEREEEVIRRASQESRQPFDLSRGPLIRTRLLRVGEEDHVLLLTMHHVVSDGWSMGILAREITALYEAHTSGKPLQLPELELQYADYARWQREWLQGEALERQIGYWRGQLAGAPPMLEMQTDRPRPTTQSYRGGHQPLVVGRELTEKLKQLSRRQGSTLFMTLLAVFKVSLHRYSGQTDICIGTPIAGRNRGEIEHLIGFFANTLVIRADLTGEPSFAELNKRVKETALEAYAHQDVPFEKLVEELHPVRDMSRNPLFQVMFALQNTPTVSMRLAGLTASAVDSNSESSKFDLWLSMSETGEELLGSLGYNRDIFDEVTIVRMVQHLAVLLRGVTTNADSRISQLPMLVDAERHQLLVEWNNAKEEGQRDELIHRWFETQAEQTPDSVALVFEDEELTYQELNLRANRVARLLKKKDVGPETLVGLYIERSLEMVIGILGILKAGGAYVPLDPLYPEHRLSSILEDAGLEDAGALVLLTQQSLLKNLPEHKAKAICLDSDWNVIARNGGENLVGGAEPHNSAYVIYTSGSTGKPKGVQISHHSVVHLVGVTRSTFNFGDQDVWTLFHSHSFDFSVWEIWSCILNGGRLVIVPITTAQSPKAFYNLLCTREVTVINQTPSAIRQLIQVKNEITDNVAESSVRVIICGGEALPSSVATELFEWRIPVWNFYGPTEATVWASMKEVEAEDSRRELISIGRPIRDVQLYVMDENFQPVPIGAPAELCIGGEGMARGYYRRADLTAERFTPNPFDDNPGCRLYKTGDQARYLPDGNLEFLRRIDNQVKIRGYRVEVGEIEAALNRHPVVKESVVTVREDVSGDKRLVAYIVSHAGQSPQINELQEYAKSRLPNYMIPSAFVTVEALPLTSNGKMDRRQLAADGVPIPRSGKSGIAPRDTIELQLSRIWEQLLGIHPVGVKDNFFDLGGHSMLAVQLMAHIERRFGQDLPLSILFQRSTIEELAISIRQQTENLINSPLVAIQPDGSKRPFFCVHPISGSVLCFTELARHLGADQPFYGLQSITMYDENGHNFCVQTMAACYIDAIRKIQPQGPYLIGGYSFGGYVAYEMAQQLRMQNQRIALLALLDSSAIMDVDAPSDKYVDGSPDEAALLAAFAKSENLPLSISEIRSMEPEGRVSYVLERASMAHRLPPDMGPSQFRRLLSTYKINLQALRDYRPHIYEGEVTIFRANGSQRQEDETWRPLATRGVQTYDVPGNHNTMLKEPHVEVLAERLASVLRRALNIGSSAMAEITREEIYEIRRCVE